MITTHPYVRWGVLAFLVLVLVHSVGSYSSPSYASTVSLSSAKEKLGGLVSSRAKSEVWYEGRKQTGDLTGARRVKGNELGSGRERVNATFVSLARNRDLWELLDSMRAIEDRFNSRLGLHYDWVMLNDEPFSEEFKRHTSGIASGTVKYGLIPDDHWGKNMPSWINETLARDKANEMGKLPIPYGNSVPYRKMCRYNSGFFYEHELLADYDYYWRVEPNVKFFCNLDYDPFRRMIDAKAKYGFVVSLYEYRETVATIWKTTKEWMEKFPQHLAKPNLLDWISNDDGESYNLCHFWSNFEIGSLGFYRSDAYRSFFNYLDQAGGFFYERWGDAPVHSIGAALLLKPEEFLFFSDIGYRHEPFQHCPVAALQNQCACSVKTEENFEFHGYSCTAKFKELTGYKTPTPFNTGGRPPL